MIAKTLRANLALGLLGLGLVLVGFSTAVLLELGWLGVATGGLQDILTLLATYGQLKP
jgi:hypothetical protein